MTEQTETMDQPLDQPVKRNDTATVLPYSEVRPSTVISPQAGGGTCSSCGGGIGMSPDRNCRENRSTGLSCRSVPAAEPLPGAPIMLGADHTRSGNLSPAAARPRGYRYVGRSDPSRACP